MLYISPTSFICISSGDPSFNWNSNVNSFSLDGKSISMLVSTSIWPVKKASELEDLVVMFKETPDAQLISLNCTSTLQMDGALRRTPKKHWLKIAFDYVTHNYSYIVYLVKTESGWCLWLKVSFTICSYIYQKESTVRAPLIINRSWILTIHRSRVLRKKSLNKRNWPHKIEIKIYNPQALIARVRYLKSLHSGGHFLDPLI